MSSNRIARQSTRRVADEADIAAAESDSDTFVPDAEWWARARVVQPRSKKLVSLRLDPDVLEWFRSRGKGYQTQINAVLRSYMDAAGKDRT